MFGLSSDTVVKPLNVFKNIKIENRCVRRSVFRTESSLYFLQVDFQSVVRVLNVRCCIRAWKNRSRTRRYQSKDGFFEAGRDGPKVVDVVSNESCQSITESPQRANNYTQRRI